MPSLTFALQSHDEKAVKCNNPLLRLFIKPTYVLSVVFVHHDSCSALVFFSFFVNSAFSNRRGSLSAKTTGDSRVEILDGEVGSCPQFVTIGHSPCAACAAPCSCIAF